MSYIYVSRDGAQISLAVHAVADEQVNMLCSVAKTGELGNLPVGSYKMKVHLPENTKGFLICAGRINRDKSVEPTIDKIKDSSMVVHISISCKDNGEKIVNHPGNYVHMVCKRGGRIIITRFSIERAGNGFRLTETFIQRSLQECQKEYMLENTEIIYNNWIGLDSIIKTKIGFEPRY